MSFEQALFKLDQLISRQNDYFGYFTDDVTHHNWAEERLELSDRESQEIYCWLEKFENQFKGCDRRLDSACLAGNLACHLTGLAETFHFSLEPETRKKIRSLI